MKLTKQRIVALFAAGTFGLASAMIGTSLIAKENTPENKTEIKQLPLDDVQRFSTAISQIKRYYVHDVKDQQLFDNAIRGMLAGLDPHSNYLDENDFKELTESTKGEFGGLGIEVTMENGLIKVITPIDGTPAQKAGIKPGDLIIRLDNKLVKDMTLREAVALMRGKPGSKITLMILRKNEEKPLSIVIERDIIQIQSVKSRLFDEHYGYIRVSQFQMSTVADLTKVINDFYKQTNNKLFGLILDLRNNPGGLLDSAIEMADAFLEPQKNGQEELIVYTKGRLPGSNFTAKATPGDLIHGASLVVLINEGSASASEIVAGALKDNHRGIIIGTKSFGKGSVQTVLPLGHNRGIKLTTALYYTPAGTSIQATGIVPDITVENIQIPKTAPKNQLETLQEADLKGHIANGNKPNIDNDPQKKATDSKVSSANLIYEDYQLYEALTMLKGMAVVKQLNNVASKNKDVSTKIIEK